MVGHLPEPQAIGAVALGALIFSFLYWGFGFLRMGTTGFVAQAYGAGDWQGLSDTLLRVLLLAAVLGLFTILVGRPLIDFALYLINSSEQVEDLTTQYAYLRVWSAPAVLCVYAFTGVLIGMHNTRAAFILQLILNVTNILLDLLFVLGFAWGVEGVALASVIAEYLAMVVGFYLLRLPLSNALRHYHRQRLFDRDALFNLFSANINIFIRTLALIFAFSYFTARSAEIGEIVLAANAVLLHFMSIMGHGLDGFAHAVEAMAGSAYGAKRAHLFRRAVILTTFWSGAIALLVALVYLVVGSAIVDLFTNIGSVAETAKSYLPWMVAAPILSVWCYQLDGIFIGTGQTRAMRNAMLVSLACYLMLLQILVPRWGNDGMFLGLMLFMLIRAVTLLFYFPNIERSIRHAEEDRS